MAVFEILAQCDAAVGWTFDVQSTAAPPQGELRHLTLRLSWADYNHWSPDGADRPGAVAEAVLAFLLERLDPRDLPVRLDASWARRRFPDADREIPKLIRR